MHLYFILSFYCENIYKKVNINHFYSKSISFLFLLTYNNPNHFFEREIADGVKTAGTNREVV